MESFEASRTRRQELTELLAQREASFDELRRDLGVSVRLLEDDLRHVDRSLHRGERRLVVTPPRCEGCGFAFARRHPKRFHTPGRCPRCRSERVLAARLRVTPRR